MLFCSFEFLFLFLPLTWAGYYLLGRRAGGRAAKVWLTAASFFFYAWWDVSLLLVIGSSMVVNYAMLWLLERDGGKESRLRKSAVAFGVLFNLGLLGYYKYAMFIVNNVMRLTESEFVLQGIILPLGISFFTFQQIGCLVDIYRQRRGKMYPVLDYLLFVTFFPQLIAGPIVSHAEMMPQFDEPGVTKLNGINLASGLHLFAVGLYKKLVFADFLAVWVTNGWGLSAPSFSQAWFTMIVYTFQIYFDFSGYSDMAIGLARMFNIKLPQNFNSPLRSASIQEFWRRWHITLGTFLTYYVYVPLGGNRKGKVRTYINLAIVFLVCGVWHGASWLFVMWGVINSVAVLAQRFWNERGFRMPRVLGWCCTFLLLIPAQICAYYKADWTTAMRMLDGLFSKPEFSMFRISLITHPDSYPLLYVLGAAVLVLCFPNAAGRIDRFRATKFGVAFTAFMLVVSVFHIVRVGPFIYFNF